MHRIALLVVIVLGFAFSACAVAQTPPPWDVTVTVTAPPDGGPVSSYVLYMDGVSQGTVLVGDNDFPGLITASGTYTFELEAINAVGQTRSDPVVVIITELEAPGKPSFEIQVQCDPCVITIN